MTTSTYRASQLMSKERDCLETLEAAIEHADQHRAKFGECRLCDSIPSWIGRSTR